MSLFETHKDVHLKLTKDAHAQLRGILFKKGLSLQELFEEFTQLIVAEDRAATRVVENLVTKKAQAKLDKVHKQKPLSELDQETLYNLLEEQSPLGKGEKEEDDE